MTKIPDRPENTVTLSTLLSACPEAVSYAEKQISTLNDVVTHGAFLAPMIGITSKSYAAAQERLGPVGAAISVWAILQLQPKIREVGAYFRAITSGGRSDGFDPWALIRRLAQQRCPA